MPQVVPYPLVRGARPDFAKLEMVFSGTHIAIPVPIIGFKSLDFGTSMDGQAVMGASQIQLGKTRGQAKYTCSIEMYLNEYMAMIQYISGAPGILGGYMTQDFDINLTWTTPVAFGIGPLLTADIVGCNINKDATPNKQGGEAITVSLDLMPSYILMNGKIATDDNYVSMALHSLIVL